MERPGLSAAHYRHNLLRLGNSGRLYLQRGLVHPDLRASCLPVVTGLKNWRTFVPIATCSLRAFCKEVTLASTIAALSLRKEWSLENFA